MATSDYSTGYDDLLDLPAESADARRILAFQLSPAKLARLDTLRVEIRSQEVERTDHRWITVGCRYLHA